MTVAANTPREVKNGNGVTTVWPFAFQFFTSAEIKVTRVSATGVETVQTISVNYTVSGGGGDAGSITTTSFTLATGEKLVIERVTLQTQASAFQENAGVPSDVLETVLDRVVMVVQEFVDKVNRSLKTAAASAYANLTLPDPVAGLFLRWKADLTGLENTTIVSSGALGLPVAIVDGGTGATTAAGARAAFDVFEDVFTTRGDLLRGGAGGAEERLALGASGKILKSDGTDVVWGDELSIPRSYLAGYTLVNNTGDATNDIDINPGVCRDTADTVAITLASALTKQLDAAWAVGSAAGMRDTGAIANGTWHIHAIRRPDTGVVDILASLAADEVGTFTVTIASPAVVTEVNHGRVNGASVVLSTTGALPTGLTAGTLYYVVNAAADTYQLSATQGGAAINTSGSQSGVHTAKGTPVLPASYTQFRRIGSILRVGATILAFVQNGDEFLFNAVTLDVSATNPGTAAVLRTLPVPTGIAVGAKFNFNSQNVGSGVYSYAYFSSPLVSDQAPSKTAAPLIDGDATLTGSDGAGSGWKSVITNKSAQVRSRLVGSDASVTLYMATVGWSDRRGRDA